MSLPGTLTWEKIDEMYRAIQAEKQKTMKMTLAIMLPACFLAGAIFAINWPWPNPDYATSGWKCVLALATFCVASNILIIKAKR